MVKLNPCHMNEITFENLPKAVSELYDEVVSLKQLLIQKNRANGPVEDIWFDLKGLCNYLPDKPSKMTVYGWVHHQSIPFHKGAKKLRFLKSEIDSWLRNGKKDSLSGSEIIPEHLLKTKGGKR